MKMSAKPEFGPKSN